MCLCIHHIYIYVNVYVLKHVCEKKQTMVYTKIIYQKKRKIYSGTKCVDMDKAMKKCVYIYILYN